MSILRTNSPTSVRLGDDLGYICVCAILPNRLTFWDGAPSLIDELAQGTASVMVDWNMKTSSVMVYVCVLRGKEAIPFSQEKKNHIYLVRMPVVEAELSGCCNCMIFMCRICCNDCDYWRWLVGLHIMEFALSITACADWALHVMNVREEGFA